MRQLREMPKLALAVLAAGMLVITACETKEGTGTIVGAAGGAAVGSLFGSGSGRILAVGAGAVVGGVVGNRVGAYMDEKDRLEAEAALRKAQTAPVGQSVTWNNPDSGASGSVTPVREGKDGAGNDCREFKHTVTKDGETREDSGIACRHADGTWTTLDE